MNANESNVKISKTTFLIGGFFVAAAIGLVKVTYSFTDKAKPSPETAGASHASTENYLENSVKENRENRHIETKLAVLSARQNSLAEDFGRLEDKVEETRSSGPAAENPPLSQEDAEQEAKQRAQQQAALLSSTVENEPADPAWSQLADDQINTTFQETGLLRSFKSKCQSTLCKIDVQFADAGQASQDFRILGTRLPWSAQMFGQINLETNEATIYLAREGYVLPQPEM